MIKGTYHSFKSRIKISKIVKQQWKDSTYREKMSEIRRTKIGKKAPNWKGGKKIDRNGYISIYKPEHPYACNKYIKEHRLVIEKQIGRYLLPEEMPHHINGIKNYNRPENLMLFKNRSAHVRFEKGGKVKPKEIIFNGCNHCL